METIRKATQEDLFHIGTCIYDGGDLPFVNYVDPEGKESKFLSWGKYSLVAVAPVKEIIGYISGYDSIFENKDKTKMRCCHISKLVVHNDYKSDDIALWKTLVLCLEEIASLDGRDLMIIDIPKPDQNEKMINMFNMIGYSTDNSRNKQSDNSKKKQSDNSKKKQSDNSDNSEKKQSDNSNPTMLFKYNLPATKKETPCASSTHTETRVTSSVHAKSPEASTSSPTLPIRERTSRGSTHTETRATSSVHTKSPEASTSSPTLPVRGRTGRTSRGRTSRGRTSRGRSSRRGNFQYNLPAGEKEETEETSCPSSTNTEDATSSATNSNADIPATDSAATVVRATVLANSQSEPVVESLNCNQGGAVSLED